MLKLLSNSLPPSTRSSRSLSLPLSLSHRSLLSGDPPPLSRNLAIFDVGCELLSSTQKGEVQSLDTAPTTPFLAHTTESTQIFHSNHTFHRSNHSNLQGQNSRRDRRGNIQKTLFYIFFSVHGVATTDACAVDQAPALLAGEDGWRLKRRQRGVV